MSHMTEMRVRMRDLDALEEAAPECGLRLERGKTTHRWYGRFVGDTRPPQGRDPKDYGRCEHALVFDGAGPQDYEIGLVRALDGDGYDLMLDTWGPGGRLVQACGGPDLPKLRREYAAAVTMRRARQALARKGFTASRENLDGGRIRLRLRRR